MAIEVGMCIRKGDFHYVVTKMDKSHVHYTRHGGLLGILSCSAGRVFFENLIEGGETVPPLTGAENVSTTHVP